jgi:hypothetical protein
LTDDLGCFGHRGSVKNRTKAVRREVLILTVLWRVSVQRFFLGTCRHKPSGSWPMSA